MSLGAKPLSEVGVRAVIDRKLADFAHVAREIEVRHMRLDAYLEAAAEHPAIRLALDTGYLADVEQLKDPVLNRGTTVLTCPALAVRVLQAEPAELHRPFVEGAFFRKFFLYFVPAHQDWEAVDKVRQIMQRHFALQLIAAETVLGEAA